MIWIVLTCLTLIAVWFVVQPLFWKGTSTDASASSLSVYRAQLNEVEADLGRGLINAAEAESARIEIKRRILALGVPANNSETAIISRATALGVGVIFSVSVAGIYLSLGSPSLPGQPFTVDREPAALSDNAAPQLDAMIEKLVTHLKSKQDDAEGWRALGWAQIQVGKTEEGVGALRKAAALAPNNVSILSMFGEGIVRLANGDVTDEALAAFERVLVLDAKDPRARFYKGLYLSRHGQGQKALALWIEIIRDSPPDAEWLPSIRSEARALAEKLKVDPAMVP